MTNSLSWTERPCFLTAIVFTAMLISRKERLRESKDFSFGAESYKVIPMTENPKYRPLMQALSREIDQGATEICLWDFDHGSGEPRAIFSDDALLRAASQHGKPLYVMEMPGADPLIEQFFKGTDAEVQKLKGDLTKAGGMLKESIPILDDFRAGKLALMSPDPRGEVLEKFIAGLDAPKKSLFLGFIQAVQGDHPGKTSIQSLMDYVKGLTPEQKEIFPKLVAGFTAAAGANGSNFDTTAVDQIIAERVRDWRALPEWQGHTAIMIYGAAHFAKSTPDLDELSLRPGERSVSVGVVSHPAEKDFLQGMYSLGGHKDLPDYAWYTEQNRLVKLDNDRAKAEFLGIQPSQVAMFEKTGIYPKSEIFLDSRLLQNVPQLDSTNVSQAPATGSPQGMPDFSNPFISDKARPVPAGSNAKRGTTRG